MQAAGQVARTLALVHGETGQDEGLARAHPHLTGELAVPLGEGQVEPAGRPGQLLGRVLRGRLGAVAAFVLTTLGHLRFLSLVKYLDV